MYSGWLKKLTQVEWRNARKVAEVRTCHLCANLSRTKRISWKRYKAFKWYEEAWAYREQHCSANEHVVTDIDDLKVALVNQWRRFFKRSIDKAISQLRKRLELRGRSK